MVKSSEGLAEASLEVSSKFGNEHQRANALGGLNGFAAHVEQVVDFGVQILLADYRLLVEAFERRSAGRVVKGFAPSHLFDQESRRHRGIGLGSDCRAAQFAQIGGAEQGIFQPSIGLIDPRCPLQSQSLRTGAGPDMAIGMDFGLQHPSPLVEEGGIDRVLNGQAKKREIVVGEIHRVGWIGWLRRRGR
jgi:hypothetical protein